MEVKLNGSDSRLVHRALGSLITQLRVKEFAMTRGATPRDAAVLSKTRSELEAAEVLHASLDAMIYDL